MALRFFKDWFNDGTPRLVEVGIGIGVYRGEQYIGGFAFRKGLLEGEEPVS